MKSISNWSCAAIAVVLFAGPVSAADAIASGKVKSIDADNKQFVLTDSASKDFTIKFAENVVVNRGGKESKSDLKVDDAVNVCYQKGLVTWTAHYILVQEDATKNCELMLGSVKSYDSEKKDLVFTDVDRKDRTFPMGDAKVRLNKEDSKIEDVKIGDHALALVETKGDKMTLKRLMVDRK